MSTPAKSIVNLMIALAKFRAECPTVHKSTKNTFHKNKYATFEDVVKAIGPPLAANDLNYIQIPGDGEMTTVLVHLVSGESVESKMTLSMKSQTNPQDLGSALTYARRYALVSLLGLSAGDEDDDGEAARKGDVRAQGAAKVAAAEAKKDEMTPEHKDWKGVVLKFHTKIVTIEKVRSHFRLSESSKKRLIQDATALDLDQTAKTMANV